MTVTAGRAEPHTTFGKLLRYSAASLAGSVVGQGTLISLTAIADWPGVPANLVAVTLGSIPNYLVNRAWTWQKRDKHSWSREVLPFWMMAIAGLILSTLFVAYADDRWGTALAVSLANASGFGVLWVAKFLVLDRVLFKHTAVEDQLLP